MRLINRLIVRFCVWYLTKDAVRHSYNPGDHFWYKQELWRAGIYE